MTFQEMKKNLDRIIINNKEFKQIQKWQTNTNDETCKNICRKKTFFPLNAFVLDVETKKGVYQSLIIELDNFDIRSLKCTGSNGNVFTAKRDDVKGGWNFEGEGQVTKDIIEGVFAIVLGILYYIATKSRERIEAVSPNVTRQERENYQYQDRECFLLNDIVKYVSIHPNRKSIQYRCECWGVRGHIRHLPNGNMVFIKPFKKGRKRDILEPKKKDYLLGGWRE